MRKGLTLIELIFSMAIIGIVFTVIPKLIMAMNQNASVTIKEEALFNALAYTGKIIYLPWDQNNTDNDKILFTGGLSDYNCTDGYRNGKFYGSRQCDDLNRTASAIGHDTTPAEYNDIDDYDQNITTPDINCSGTPKLLTTQSISATVSYVNDPILINPYISNTFELNTTSVSNSNTKYIDIKVANCSILRYHSFNIGRVGFKNRIWD